MSQTSCACSERVAAFDHDAGPAVSEQWGLPLPSWVAHRCASLAGADGSTGGWLDKTLLRTIQLERGRSLAARLLTQLGANDDHVGMAADRSPLWPAGFVGSISHTEDLVAVAVAPAMRCGSLGIDVERIVSNTVADDIAPVCFSAHELVDSGWRSLSLAHRCSIGFSAKEALYKCLHPLTGLFMEFTDAEIRAVDLERGRIQVSLSRDIAPGFRAGQCLTGSFRVSDHHVFSAFLTDAQPSVLRSWNAQ
jgi:enterobactin synthetase component D